MSQRTAIDSKLFQSIGYENGVLEAEFKSDGSVWQYEVPEPEYRAMMQAGSIGSYFYKHIRPRGGRKIG